MKDLKPIRYYLALMVILLGYYAYTTYEGIGYYDSKPERNTESAARAHGRAGIYGNRFYHK